MRKSPEPESPDALGCVIHNSRIDWQMTQAELGEKADLSRSYLAQIENGDRIPSPDVIARLAEALQLPTVMLLGMAGWLDEAEQKRAALAEVAGQGLAAVLNFFERLRGPRPLRPDQVEMLKNMGFFDGDGEDESEHAALPEPPHGWNELTPANRQAIDALIQHLLSQQRGE